MKYIKTPYGKCHRVFNFSLKTHSKELNSPAYISVIFLNELFLIANQQNNCCSTDNAH